MKNNYIYIILLLWVLTGISLSNVLGQQSGVIYQDLELSSPLTENINLEASNTIILKPGFSSAGHTFTATVSEVKLYNSYTDLSEITDKNYTRQIVPKEPVKDIIDIKYLTVDKVYDQISYFDGLGRKLQTHAMGATDAGESIIQLYSYDEYGRPDTAFLPFVHKSNGGYLDEAYEIQKSFYNNPNDKIADDSSPWSTVQYDTSPLNRVLKSGSVGDNWQLETNNTVSNQVMTNSVTDTVIKWTYNATGNTYTGTANYSSGSLFKKTVTDENGKTVTVYTDRDGKTILKEQAGLQTYYLYDVYGRMTHVLPPEFVEQLASYSYIVDPSKTYVKEYCYTYVYGERSLLIEKYLPGVEKIEYVYDKFNRPVMSRNGNLRENHQWSFVKYDQLGRTVISGLWTDNNTTKLTRAGLQELFFGADYTYEEYDETLEAYTDRVFPTGADKHVINYYDEYTPESYNCNVSVMDGDAYTDNTLGLLTTTKVKVLDGSNNYLVSTYYYNEKGQQLQVLKENIFGKVDITAFRYNFMGQAEIVEVEHTMADNQIEKVTKYYTYDEAGRLADVEQEIEVDSQNGRVKMVEMEYNKLGQVTAKKLHETASNQFLQTVDYNYNIRGWLTSINDPDNQGSDNDLFAMRLHYNDEIKAETALNNGMISGIEWKIFGSKSTSGTKKRTYAFTYDDHYRLTEADYFDDDATTQENFDVSYNYTANGKISSLQRYGKTGEGSYGKIDDLTYTYSGNQLTKVDDAGLVGQSTGLPNNFPDLETTEQTEYLYDENGNMYVDKNKGLTNITYNHLNLPTKVDFEDGSYINFLYDAQGNKLEKEVKQAGSTSDFYTFVGGFIYENDNLTQIATEQGRVTVSGTTYKYEYYLKDHLGSTRVMFADDGNGNAEILQETHYYPFGLTIDGLSFGGQENSTLFSGKEYNSEINLNWYDFGARNYDPSLGMWFNVDPMAEKYISSSPYHFTANNPVNFRETNGMEFEWRDPDDTPEGGGNFGNGSGAAAPNSILYALLGGYGNMFGSDFFRNSMDEGSFYSSLTTEQYDQLQAIRNNQEVFEQALSTGSVDGLAEGHYTSDGRFYSVYSYGGDGNGNGFVNFTGYGAMMFGNGNYKGGVSGYAFALASINSGLAPPKPLANVIGRVGAEDDDSWIKNVPDCVKVPIKQRIHDRTTEFTAPLGMNRYKTWKHTYRTIYNLEYAYYPEDWVVTNVNLDTDSYTFTLDYPTTIEDGIYYLEYGPPTTKTRVYNFLDTFNNLSSWDTMNVIIIDL